MFRYSAIILRFSACRCLTGLFLKTSVLRGLNAV
nr:MAG TPA: hypothetical protein [Caudoviricetes sp.]